MHNAWSSIEEMPYCFSKSYVKLQGHTALKIVEFDPDWSLLAKNNFFVQFWTKKFASSRMANCGSGLPAEWPFRSQNAIEASDSPLPGGLWVKRLITHALCSLAYSDIAWCKLFLIFTMKCLYWVFFAYKTPYSVLIDNSIYIQEIDTEKTWLTLQGQFFRCIKPGTSIPIY